MEHEFGVRINGSHTIYVFTCIIGSHILIFTYTIMNKESIILLNQWFNTTFGTSLKRTTIIFSMKHKEHVGLKMGGSKRFKQKANCMSIRSPLSPTKPRMHPQVFGTPKVDKAYTTTMFSLPKWSRKFNECCTWATTICSHGMGWDFPTLFGGRWHLHISTFFILCLCFSINLFFIWNKNKKLYILFKTT